jgi:3-deoxy-manno-octulosonate cytidylyltransferase (CMP-KDO synthetase)
MLADRTGKPLIQHVYEQVARSASAKLVLVATDDERIRDAVHRFGGVAVMTRADHPNGTSRIAEAVESSSSEFIVNVQGDEPEFEPELIDLAVEALFRDSDCVMSTVACRFEPDERAADSNIVKVVIDQRSRAMYFSRSLIPFRREPEEAGGGPLKHVGLYVYRREFLRRYVNLPATPLERSERLEQLRALEHGYEIAVAVGRARYHGIDTPEQYEAFVRRWRECHGGD